MIFRRLPVNPSQGEEGTYVAVVIYVGIPCLSFMVMGYVFQLWPGKSLMTRGLDSSNKNVKATLPGKLLRPAEVTVEREQGLECHPLCF